MIYREYNYGINFDYIIPIDKLGHYLPKNEFEYLLVKDVRLLLNIMNVKKDIFKKTFFISNDCYYFQFPSSNYNNALTLKNLYLNLNFDSITLTFWEKPFNFGESGYLFYYNKKDDYKTYLMYNSKDVTDSCFDS